MKKIKNIRFVVQMASLLTIIIASINHYLNSLGQGFSWISESIFHYFCPICGVTSIYQFFASSSLWIVKLKSTLGITIGLVIMTTIIFGPILCGYICPFGALQDLIAKLGKKLNRKKYNKFIPEKVDKNLRYLRYLTLTAAIILTATSSVAILESINPYHAFLGIFKRSVSIPGFVILCIVIATSLFIQRPWCKYLCPYGAFLGMFNKIKVFRIVRSKNTCISCKRCSSTCPMSINVHSEEEVRNSSCISCFECVEEKICPRENTLICTSNDIDINDSQININSEIEEVSNEK